jgi:small-conductance mechanosensitive channel
MIERLVAWISTIPYLDNKYGQALGILITFAILAKLVLIAFNIYLQRVARKTKTKVDDYIFENTKRPLFYLIILYGAKVAATHLRIFFLFEKLIASLLVGISLIIVSRTVVVLIGAWGEIFAKRTKTKIDEVLLPLFCRAIRVVLVVVGLMWILDIWQINITPYLAGVGISGLVLGLALQDSLKNVFGGITLILDKTFQVDDKIKLESGEVGTIHDIGLRSTKLITYDNEVIYIPNGYLANSRVQNYTRPNPKVRTSVQFGITYGTDPAKVKQVVLAALKKMDGILEDPAPSVVFLEMADYSLNFAAKFWVAEWGAAYGKKLEATEVIYNALNKAKIIIPFPTRTVYMKK